MLLMFSAGRWALGRALGRVRADQDPPSAQQLIESMDPSDRGRVPRWSRVVAAVGTSPWEASGPFWLVPKPLLSKERARPCSEMGLLYLWLGRCRCSALCQLGAPQLCSPSTEHSLALGLKEDLNCAEMPQAADAGRELQAGQQSSAGRNERTCSCCYSFSRYFFGRHQIFKMFLFQAGLEAPCTASEGSPEPCLMPCKGRQLQSC